jgi:hypothetical protein
MRIFISGSTIEQIEDIKNNNVKSVTIMATEDYEKLLAKGDAALPENFDKEAHLEYLKSMSSGELDEYSKQYCQDLGQMTVFMNHELIIKEIE